MPTLYTLPVITTKYFCPTDTRGARVKATSGSGRAIVAPWQYGAGEAENHATAAAALAGQIFNAPPESFRLCGGCTADGRYAFTVEKIEA